MHSSAIRSSRTRDPVRTEDHGSADDQATATTAFEKGGEIDKWVRRFLTTFSLLAMAAAIAVAVMVDDPVRKY